MRFNPPRTFIGGLDNWARMKVVTLPRPDQDGYIHRICIVFDTKVYSDGDENEFLDLTWVDGWLREVFTHHATEREQRSEADQRTALRGFEYQAHYLNLLDMLGKQLRIPGITLVAGTRQEPDISVDLILYVGNSQTCGILVEDHPEAHNGLSQSYELQLRDLEQPHQIYNEMFESRIEFAHAQFGKPNFSLESGREDAFLWPSIVRVGREASRMALSRLGTEGASGLSSPSRYLWDEESYTPGWRFSKTGGNAALEPHAIAAPFTHLINDEGQPLFTVPFDDRLSVFSAQYSRSSLMTLMLCELLAQALSQINSAAQRVACVTSF